MGGKTHLQRIDCSCGNIHMLSSTALQIVVQAFINGDGHSVNGEAVNARCLYDIIDDTEHRRRTDRVVIR